MLRNGKLSNAIDKNRKKLQTALCKNQGKLSGGGGKNETTISPMIAPKMVGLFSQ